MKTVIIFFLTQTIQIFLCYLHRARDDLTLFCYIYTIFLVFRIDFYIIGTHSNNVLIWFTKRILGTVFVSQMGITHIFLKSTTPIDPVFCHHTA